ncbi:uncharacterized protein LOC143279409 [Babylonia areolata]|uniref:uncharacterized protein LOC143279409 n=1 Tax=Babylonia areolata TaxID=304850 RepID=UPI003FD67E09
MCCSPVACVAKVIMGIINTLIFLVGLAMFIIGVLIQTQPSLSKDALSGLLSNLEDTASSAGVTLDTSNFSAADLAYSFTIALIVSGLLLAAISLLGLIGTKYSLKPVLIVYFIIVLVLFLAQVIVVLIIVIDRSALDDAIKPRLKDTITDDFTGLEGTDATTLMWNGVMMKLECCGVDGYTDFTAASAWTKTINSVTYALVTPVACCKSVSTSYTCAETPSTSNNYLDTGCYDEMWDFVLKDSGIVPALAAVLLAFQLAVLILTIIILKSMSIVGVV